MKALHAAGAHRGLHALPALGLGAGQQETLRVAPKIHLQVDVQVHGGLKTASEPLHRDLQPL